ncbi:MAG: glutathione S-transferase [Myxococcota bacterium]|jgi:glutathione S-transferase
MSHTLYAHPFACSLAPHIVLVQHAIPAEVRWLPRGPGRQIPDAAYDAIHPRRKVPALVLPDGTTVTELIVVLLHLEEAHGPPRTRDEHRQLLTWLSFLATELHQGVLGPTFDPAAPPESVADARSRLMPPVLSHVAAGLADPLAPIGGDEPTAVDALLFWCELLLNVRWPDALPPALAAHRKMMLGRPLVRTVLAREEQARTELSA